MKITNELFTEIQEELLEKVTNEINNITAVIWIEDGETVGDEKKYLFSHHFSQMQAANGAPKILKAQAVKTLYTFVTNTLTRVVEEYKETSIVGVCLEDLKRASLKYDPYSKRFYIHYLFKHRILPK